MGSREWPLISRYRAEVRTQSPKEEMIASLFGPDSNGGDNGIFRHALSSALPSYYLFVAMDYLLISVSF